MIELYNAQWNVGLEPLEIEMECIRQGGRWIMRRNKQDVECGNGLSYHYEAMRRILWPDLDGEHNGQRWHAQTRDAILSNKVTVLMGAASTGKTHSAAWIYLCEYLCFPDETCVLVSSTHIDGLRLRVWGEMTQLWQQAVDKFDFLPGHLLDNKLLISTDEISEDSFDERRVRDWRKGIKGVPCMQNNKFVGLSKYMGIKQKRVRLVGDELQFMGGAFLSAFSNLDKNEDFKATLCGNPVDVMDPLGRAAEPLDGWQSHMAPDKTATWKTRFMDGVCINLVGSDSPNFDFPAEKKDRFPYLIGRAKIERTRRSFGEDSVEFFSQCVGTMKGGMLEKRVMTREFCERFGATKEVMWRGTPLVSIFALDTSWGGDRCVGGHGDFGLNVDGEMIISPHEPQEIPIKKGIIKSEEDQISEWVRDYCEAWNIPPENVFHDSTGKGTLGTSLSRIWSPMTNPVAFGGSPTERPVNLDMYILDPKTKLRRLKTCKEHYFNFVTELWFSVKYGIEAAQMRNLPLQCLEELCMRKWELHNGLYQVEPKSGTPTKPGMKERTGRSPDYGDWIAIVIEGARRRGFEIKRLANPEYQRMDREWVDDMARRALQRKESRTAQLNYSA
jgi:hypothetical protein